MNAIEFLFIGCHHKNLKFPFDFKWVSPENKNRMMDSGIFKPRSKLVFIILLLLNIYEAIQKATFLSYQIQETN